MPVLTADTTIPGVRRESVFQWLSRPDNHRRFLEAAFSAVTEKAPGALELGVPLHFREHRFRYTFTGTDDTHGGRRILVRTDSRRVRGNLRYSLRTEKPSTHTLVTLHLDYDPGWVGYALDRIILRTRLERLFHDALENLSRLVQAENAKNG